MASNWRVVSETVKQKWKVSADRAFKPTINARNEAMFRDASMFADTLRKFKKDMQVWQKRIEGSFADIRNTMESPLPQAYDVGHDGRPAAVTEPKLIGAGVDTEMLAATAQEYSRRMGEEILQPVKDWLHSYAAAQEGLKNLEAMRLDLDSRRRTVHDLQGKYERQQSFTAQQQPNIPPPSPRQISDMQQTYSKMRHKEDKLQTAQHQWDTAESALWEQLRNLVEAAQNLREHMVAFITITKDCFAGAYGAFIPNPATAAMLPQNMAGLRINTTGKSSSYHPHMAPTPTKKLLAQVASAMMGAAKKTKDLVTPRAHSYVTQTTPFRPESLPSPMGTPHSGYSAPYFKDPTSTPTHPYSKSPATPQSGDYTSKAADPYGSGRRTPSGKDHGNPYTPKGADNYATNPYTPKGADSYATNPYTPKGADSYATNPYTPKGADATNPYTPKGDSYGYTPSPFGTPKAAADSHGKADQFGSNPYSNYQPVAPKWSPTANVPGAGQYVY